MSFTPDQSRVRLNLDAPKIHPSQPLIVTSRVDAISRASSAAARATSTQADVRIDIRPYLPDKISVLHDPSTLPTAPRGWNTGRIAVSTSDQKIQVTPANLTLKRADVFTAGQQRQDPDSTQNVETTAVTIVVKPQMKGPAEIPGTQSTAGGGMDGRVPPGGSETAQAAGEPHEIKQIITNLYSGHIEGLRISTRNPDEYRNILGLETVPIDASARVLDIGSGAATITASAFGLAEDRFVRADIFPVQPGIQEANVLDLPYEDDSFNEVWASFIVRQLDTALPESIQEKIIQAGEESGIEVDNTALLDGFKQIFGLQALSEMLRVTKVGGRIRIASFEADFEDSPGLHTFENTISQGNIVGINVNKTEVAETFDPQGPCVNKFFEKGSDYDQERMDALIETSYRRLIPPEVVRILRGEMHGDTNGDLDSDSGGFPVEVWKRKQSIVIAPPEDMTDPKLRNRWSELDKFLDIVEELLPEGARESDLRIAFSKVRLRDGFLYRLAQMGIIPEPQQNILFSPFAIAIGLYLERQYASGVTGINRSNVRDMAIQIAVQRTEKKNQTES